MRKVTRRLLAVGVAVLTLGACQDSVTVVQPDPPPPPPPPAEIDATVSILGLDLIPGPGSANPTAVAGDINVSLNVEEGDNTVTQIDLLFDGAPIGCQAIQTNLAPGEAGEELSFSTAAAADVVECFWNTDDVQGTCDGSNLPPAFPNGTHELGAQITLDDGTTRTASNTQTVTLVNGSFILVATDFDRPAVVGTNGRPFWGGPEDLDGDGTDDNVNAFALCPVSYNGTVVGTLSAVATTDGPVAADLGAGLGAVATATAEPFVFVLDSGDNDTVEDDPATGLVGHTVMSTGSVFDDAGLNVTAEFAHGAVGGNQTLYLDFTAPVVAAGAEIQADGASTAGGEYYSTAAFTLTGVSDGGVGFTFGSGVGSRIDTGDCSVAANFDDDPATAFVPLFEDVSATDDADEEDPSPGDDGGSPPGPDLANDCYVAEVVGLEDRLANVTDLVAVGAPDGAINTGAGGTAAPWGVDVTPPDLSGLLPDTDPADDPVFVLNPDPDGDGGLDPDDFSLSFMTSDPPLATGEPGARLDLTGCDPCAAITAVDQDGTGWPVNQLIGFNFEADITGQADGPYTVTLTSSDAAVPPNLGTDDYTYVLDNTPPVIGALDPAPIGSSGTDANSIVMRIGETITDANPMPNATLTVGVDGTDATGTGATGVCTPGSIYTLSVAAGEIDRNVIDLTGGTPATSYDFSASGGVPEVFSIPDPFGPGVGGTVRYCFVIDAEDGALDKFGAPAPNAGQLVTEVLVTWNAN